jgi:hypothetical protein
MIPDLAQTWDEVWTLLDSHLLRGVPRRFVTLASCDASGAPQLRTVALRACDKAAGTLAIYTDALSCKVGEIRANPAVSVLVWEAEPRVQLRLNGRAMIETGTGLRPAWEALPAESRLSYSHLPPPGAPIAASGAYEQRPDFARFARIAVTLDSIDHVSLAETGHRRALFRRDDGWRGQWRAP